jgi:hypothetical protein
MKKDANKRNNGYQKILIIFGALLVIIIGIVIFWAIKNTRPDRVVALVNGEPISELEFKLRLIQNRAYVYDYFKRKYGVSDHQKFWDMSYGGETPIKVARVKTLNECVTIKVQQILAKQKGIIRDISYQGFLEVLKQENLRRKEAVQQGRPIYGPRQYDESGYYYYLFENMVIRLKDVLAENELKVTDQQIAEYYQQIKDRKFRKEDAIKIQKLSISYTDKGSEIAEREVVKSIMEQIRNRLLKGERFEEITRTCKLKNPLKLNYGEQVMDSNSGRLDSRNNPILRSVADQTKAGQFSEVFEENGALMIIKPIVKTAGGYSDFNEYQDVVKSNLIDQRYDGLIDRLVKEAQIEIKDDVYRQLKY